MSRSPLDDFQAFIESYAEDHLRLYLDRLPTALRRLSPKEFNDPVWGTINLSALEVAIIDTPLHQRLRRVRQLGVVHWIYHGATHTRFDHTLGVVHQVQSLINAINTNQNAGSASAPIIDENHAKLLRIAALFHDTGHGCFSHVSETALLTLPAFQVLCQQFNEKYETENVQLSEVAAYFIVRSPAVRRLFQLLVDHAPHPPLLTTSAANNVTALVERTANAIVGLPISNAIPLLHELISGPFDADKLDYMARDAHFCGVPKIIDFSRVVPRLSAPISIARAIRVSYRSSLRAGTAEADSQALR